jgi:hypothetical protein
MYSLSHPLHTCLGQTFNRMFERSVVWSDDAQKLVGIAFVRACVQINLGQS